jgi:adenylate cyclase
MLFTGVADLYELKTLDWRFRALARPERADSSVVLVLLDQRSLDFYEQEEGIPWPWPRQMYQPLVDYCRMAGARGVAFDVVFSEPSFYSLQDDSTFAGAMAKAGNTALGVPLTRMEEGGELSQKLFLPVGEPERRLPSYSGAQMPIPVLSEAAATLGSVTFLPNDDGIYRSLAHLALCGGGTVPSLPLALLLAAHPPEDVEVREDALRVRGNTVPMDDSGETPLFFWGPVTAYRQFSMASIIQSYLRLEEGLSPIVPPDVLRGAYVLVGFSAPGLYDLRPVPLGGAYPGVAIHATALDNLLNGDFLRRVPGWVALLAAAAAGGAIAFLASAVKRLWLVGPAFIAMLALVVGASLAAFRMLWWLQLVPLVGAVSLAFLGTVLANFAAERKEKRFLRTAFSHYLNPSMVEEIVKNPSLLKLGGERREMTVHFSDIAGFTTIAEGMEPSELTEMLNTYLSEMTDIILETGGTLDKYEGDAIIAFWGAPLEQPDHALRGCRAVLACREKLAELQTRFAERGWPELRARLGLSSGPMVVGNMGSHSRFDYTVIGDNVNLAARLEGANKVFGTDILLSEDAYQAAGDAVVCREVALLRVKGKRRAVAVYQPMALRSQASDELMEMVRIHGQAIEKFRARQWADAAELFEQLPEDPLAQWYTAQCRNLAGAPPPDDWDGVVILETK